MTTRRRKNKQLRLRTVFSPLLPLVRSLVQGDLTLCESDRKHLVKVIDSCIQNPGGKHLGLPPRILTRREVAEQFGIALRTVDYWGKSGKLRRVILPGRQRAIGFLEKDIAELFAVDNYSEQPQST